MKELLDQQCISQPMKPLEGIVLRGTQAVDPDVGVVDPIAKRGHVHPLQQHRAIRVVGVDPNERLRGIIAAWKARLTSALPPFGDMHTASGFGSWVQMRRKMLGLTQAELAHQVGCSIETMRKIEARKRRPSRQLAERLAQFLEIAPDDLPAFIRAARFAPPATDEPSNERLLAPPAETPRPAGPLYTPPAQPFFGREQELHNLDAQLAQADCRLITLLGPGGIGKTRIAQQFAALQAPRFAQGAAFVALASVTDHAFISAAIANTLGLTFANGGEPTQQLLAYLRNRELLLVLDNTEHLPQSAELVRMILENTLKLKVIVTTRERLGLREEWVYHVAGLDVPAKDQTAELHTSSAVRLFLQHARRAQSDFRLDQSNDRDVVQICSILDGMPLGIELAASWVRVLSCGDIAAGIADNLDFLASPLRDMPERHRSIRVVLDHSWRLLTHDEQHIVRRLAAFRGGFTREAAARVAGATLPQLLALVDKSLLNRDASGRYTLHELVRQYAEEQLRAAPDEANQARNNHTSYYTGLLRSREEALKGGGQQAALAELSPEIDNLHQAWEWAIMQRNLAALRDEARALSLLCDMRGWYNQAASYFGAALVMLRRLEGEAGELNAEQRIVMAELLTYYSWHNEGLHNVTEELMYSTLDQLAELDEPHVLSDMLLHFGVILQYEGNYDESQRLLARGRALKQRLGDRWGVAFGLAYEGTLALVQDQPAEALALLSESCAISRKSGDTYGLVRTLGYTAHASYLVGDIATAEHMLHECIRLCGTIGARFGIATAYEMLGRISFDQHDYQTAKRFFQQSLETFQELGDAGEMQLMHLGATTLRLGDTQTAEQYLRAALQSTSSPIALFALLYYAELQQQRDHLEQALELVQVVLAHPALPRTRLPQANQLRANLEQSLTAEQIAAAQARAETLTLDRVQLMLA